MKSEIMNRFDRLIRICFYALFALTPLVMYPHNFELYEFNKMWFVYGISLLVLFLWISKSIYAKSIYIRRTPFDIFILLFLASQVISMFLSIDPYVSFWGYYSRFNGGVLSFISYIFLYFAFASNMLYANKDKDNEAYNMHTLTNSLYALFIGGTAVALWGFPSHFGYDPTCLMFRGSLDVACWTDAFQPKVRIFSTLGQPNWLAAYLSVLIPITIALGIKKGFENWKLEIRNWKLITTLFTGILFYLCLLYTKSQSGFVGFWAGMGTFLGLLTLFHNIPKISLAKTIKNRLIILSTTFVLILGLLTFFIGSPVEQLNKFSFNSLFTNSVRSEPTQPTKQPTGAALEVGGTESGKIRVIVWSGAIEIFKRHPFFGTGPETFAYAYYKVRPIAHNLTSEWDYLYNKAHNEYLNYLATTGIVGLGTYLLYIGYFFVFALKKIGNSVKHTDENRHNLPLMVALVASFVTILVSNFFGFSVVIINLFFFFIPLWFWIISSPKLKIATLPKKATYYSNAQAYSSPGKTIMVIIFGLFILFFEIILYRYWNADQHYALGNNLNSVGEYAKANPELIEAVRLRPNESIFKDELSVNLSTLAYLLSQQDQATQAANLAIEAKTISDMVVTSHPNNVVFQKSRTRILYSLSLFDPKYNSEAVLAIEKANFLAPTDAKISYNMALMYDAAGNRQKAIEVLHDTTKLKPNYRDAYYARALYLTELAKSSPLPQAQIYKNEAKLDLEYILKNIGGDDKQAKELLNSL